jgi:hypothetical protein
MNEADEFVRNVNKEFCLSDKKEKVHSSSDVGLNPTLPTEMVQKQNKVSNIPPQSIEDISCLTFVRRPEVWKKGKMPKRFKTKKEEKRKEVKNG